MSKPPHKKGDDLHLSDSIFALVEPEVIQPNPLPDFSRPFPIIPKPHYGDVITPLDWESIKNYLERPPFWEQPHSDPREGEDLEEAIRPFIGKVHSTNQDQQAEELHVSDTVDTDITRGLPESTPDEIEELINEGITPLTPLIVTENDLSEALRAKDEIATSIWRDTKKESGAMMHDGIQSIQIGSKKRYLHRDGVLDPCQVLEGNHRRGHYNIKHRRHVKTGNSKDRLKQIRRYYAFINC